MELTLFTTTKPRTFYCIQCHEYVTADLPVGPSVLDTNQCWVIDIATPMGRLNYQVGYERTSTPLLDSIVDNPDACCLVIGEALYRKAHSVSWGHEGPEGAEAAALVSTLIWNVAPWAAPWPLTHDKGPRAFTFSSMRHIDMDFCQKFKNEWGQIVARAYETFQEH